MSRKCIAVVLGLLNLHYIASGYECDMSADVCETSLVIEHYLTMRHPTEKSVYPKGGKLYKYDVIDTINATSISPDEVITADGWEASRLVIVANETMPGPPIIVYEGQTVIINVINKLKSEEVTIHWHGVVQSGTPYMDGVPFLTQHPISIGQTFAYKFKAHHKGTHFYHSHVGNQRTKGLFGAFIIRERKSVETEEHIMTIHEWNHDWDSDVDELMSVYGLYENRDEIEWSLFTDGERLAILKTHSGLINGKGRYTNPNTMIHNGAPLEVFSIEHGKEYRFRVIGAGEIFPWEISIDNHALTIIASDGNEIEPKVVDSFIINPGERFDFLITADQQIDNYWLRAKVLALNRNISTEAILRYKGASETEPNSHPRECTTSDRCFVLNCFFVYYVHGENTDCIQLDQLKQKSPSDPAPPATPGKFKEFFLNFIFPGSTNGRRFVLPTENVLTNPYGIDQPCDMANCGEQKVCSCTHYLSINNGETVQMVFMSMGRNKGGSHPIHLHGHSFHVLKIGYGTYDNVTGKLLAESDDIDCRGGTQRSNSMCNDATWSNSAWSNGNIPGVDLVHPIKKDTIMVPTGGYVVTRIVADNPGVWFLHCHYEFHANEGMAIYLNESFPDHPPPPQDFPVCSYKLNEKVASADMDFYTQNNFWITVGVLVAVIVLQFLVLLCCLCRKYTDENKNSAQLSGKQNPSFSSNM